MNKVIVVFLVGVLFGCGTDVSVSANKTGKNEELACAELEAISESDTSKRIEVLKSQGFSETQANDFERLVSLYRNISEHIDIQKQRKNMWATQAVSKKQACLNQYSLSCVQLLTHLEKGANEQDLAKLSSQPLSECMGQ
jgi:hypothetical protein